MAEVRYSPCRLQEANHYNKQEHSGFHLALISLRLTCFGDTLTAAQENSVVHISVGKWMQFCIPHRHQMPTLVIPDDRGVIEGDVVRVNSALLIGASPDGHKNAGKKPIHFAVENDSIQIVELLCEWGAKVNVPNPEEQNGSPLHMAVKKGFTSVAKCLLEKNADPNVKDGEGDTPLITAIRKGGISSAGLLLKYGADLKKRDKIHDSALHIAVKKNDGEIVQMLLKEGASVNNINMQGKLPNLLMSKIEFISL
ncbi:putative ankyrin repeat protein RBE_0220 [Penaeus japonicus]|uniref:putative ankyrin repeat protein RBE_0220 n=1 Tax=Penaeus japonicus TaxID=27405 RepID=UPI001C70FA85|nr:putative ankyrin repeat protein RBE_0220 [Penaeus japonicus]